MEIKKIIFIVSIFLYFSLSVNALNDINISIDSGRVQICLTEKTFTNMTCNITTFITLDGTSDHFLYFTSTDLYDPIEQEDTDKWQWAHDEFFRFIYLFIDILYFLLPFLIYLGGGLFAIYFIYNFIVNHFS